MNFETMCHDSDSWYVFKSWLHKYAIGPFNNGFMFKFQIIR